MYDHWNFMLAGKSFGRFKLYNKLTSIFRAGYTAPIYEKWLENADEKLCFWMEQFLIKSIGRKDLCNLTDGGEGSSGWIAPEETLVKMRAASAGKTHTAETREKMSKVQKGRTFTAETLVKMSKAGRARKRFPFTAEHRQKIAEANRGKPKSAEHRENMSKGLRGRKMPLVWLEKQSKRCLGKPAHPNSRLALLKANIGKPCSAEKRQKIREAALKRGVARRALKYKEILCGVV
jgi:hypothetical protein